VLVLVAPYFAPGSVMSVRSGFAVALLMLTVVWAGQVSPKARAMVLARFHRLGLRMAG
jgi:hypothetical protein